MQGQRLVGAIVTTMTISNNSNNVSVRSMVDEVIESYKASNPAFTKRTIHNETLHFGIPKSHAKQLRRVVTECFNAFVAEQTLPENWESVTNICIDIPKNTEKLKAVYFIIILDNHYERLDTAFLSEALPYTTKLLEQTEGKIDLIFNSGNHLTIQVKLDDET